MNAARGAQHPTQRLARSNRQSDSVRQRHTPKGKHAVVFLIVVVALIVAIILLAHRGTPCKLQVTNVGAGAQIEQCASTSPHTP